MNKFSIHSYVSLIDTDGKWRAAGSEEIHQLINVLINTGMTVNRWIYQVVDLGLQILLSNTLFEDTIGQVFKTSISMYHSMFNTLGTVLFIFALAVIFFIYVFKSPQEAFKKMLVLFVVIGMNFVIYTNGEGYLRDINTIFDEAESLMMQGIEMPLGEKNEYSKGSLQQIRESYFKMTIRQSFAMVNFGTSTYDERFDTFLYTDEQENSESSREELSEKIKDESKDNRYMTPDASLDKWFLSIYAWINNLFVGVPLLLIAALKFLMKVLILCMVFVLPLISILSLLPRFSTALFTFLGKMLLLFFTGTFMSLAIYLFFFVMTLIDSSIHTMAGSHSLISSVLGTVNKAILVFLVMKSKGRIIHLITAGNITHIETAVHKRLKSKLKNQVDSRKINDSVGTAVFRTDFENSGRKQDEVDIRDIVVTETRQKTNRAVTAKTVIAEDQLFSNDQNEERSKKIRTRNTKAVADLVETKGKIDLDKGRTDSTGLDDIRIYSLDEKEEGYFLTDALRREAFNSKTGTEAADFETNRLVFTQEQVEENKAFYQLLEELRTC